jgi:hypothetical protein
MIETPACLSPESSFPKTPGAPNRQFPSVFDLFQSALGFAEGQPFAPGTFWEYRRLPGNWPSDVLNWAQSLGINADGRICRGCAGSRLRSGDGVVGAEFFLGVEAGDWAGKRSKRATSKPEAAERGCARTGSCLSPEVLTYGLV